MSGQFHLLSGVGQDFKARVTSAGELVVSDYAYWLAANALLDATGTAYNFFGPKVGQQLVISGVVMRANKLVSAVSDATVDVYEATSTTDTTVAKSLIQTQIVESQVISFMPIRLKVSEGAYVNAKTDDDDISINMFGYYVPRITQ